MKGIVLGGGLGSRLRPYLSSKINKHLVPVHDRPLIHHVIGRLADAGVDEILLCFNGPNPGLLLESIGTGSSLGVHIYFRYDDQVVERGPATHILDAEHWIDNEPFILILGDSMYLRPLVIPAIVPNTAYLWATEITQEWDDYRKYAQIEVENDLVTRLERTESKFFSPIIQTGAWIFPQNVFDKTRKLFDKRREGQEVRLTHVAQSYLREQSLRAIKLEPESFIDCGTPEAISKVTAKLAEAW
tara:strand:+ start:2346 stop:3077 length:732 start_codon:yes stop_codon:yes gene_type:complete